MTRINPACDMDEKKGLNRFPSGAPVLDGVRVLIVTSGHDVSDHRVYDKLALSLQKMGAKTVIAGSSAFDFRGHVKIIKVPPPSGRLGRFLWQPWRCLWASRGFKADIVHFHDAEFLMTLPVMKLLWFKRKFVYDVHEDFANLILIRNWLPSALRGILCVLIDFFEKRLTLLADGVVGVTPPLTAKFGNRRKITAHNFVSGGFFDRAKLYSKAPRARRFDLVHLGTLSAKRAIFLADVIKEVHKLYPQAKVLVAGVLPDIMESLKSRIGAGNCLIIGKTPHHEIPRLLGNSKVAINVHPWPDPHLNVALPVKIGEYMASGCAVVTSSMPILKNIVRAAHGIEFIETDNPGDYARAVIGGLEKIKKREDPGGRLREFALRNMLWEKEALKIARLYSGLLSRRKAEG